MVTQRMFTAESVREKTLNIAFLSHVIGLDVQFIS